MLAGGHFQTQVYYCETMDLFIAVDCHARPTPNGWVVVKHVAPGEIVIERYHGQSHVGVVRLLQFYPLTQSSQRDPRLSVPVCPD